VKANRPAVAIGPPNASRQEIGFERTIPPISLVEQVRIKTCRSGGICHGRRLKTINPRRRRSRGACNRVLQSVPWARIVVSWNFRLLLGSRQHEELARRGLDSVGSGFPGCPLIILCGHAQCADQCPLRWGKRTSLIRSLMSANDQARRCSFPLKMRAKRGPSSVPAFLLHMAALHGSFSGF